MKKLGLALAGSLGLFACLCYAAGQATTPTPGKDGWVSMFDGETLEGWKPNEHPESWKVVDGTLTGDGPRSHLFWMVRECEDCEFRAEFKLNHGGNSGMFFRAAFGPGFPKGYEAQVENTSPDPQKTGSVYSICSVTEQLVEDDAWTTQEIAFESNHIVIKVNGKVAIDCADERKRYTRGYFALQQYGPGTVVQYRNLMMRELPAK
jgi:hypothetical protein